MNNKEDNLKNPVTENELIEVLENIPHYPKCKVKEFFLHHKSKEFLKYYKKVDSNQQFNSLLKLAKFESSDHLNQYGNNITNRLLSLICRDNDFNYYQSVLRKILKSKNDDEVYDFLKFKNKQTYKKFKNKVKVKDPIYKDLYCSRSVLFGQIFGYHSRKIKDELTNYLDIGCGDGRKTLEYANNLGISDPKKIHCVEMPSFQEQENWWKNSDKKFEIKIVKPDEKYPYRKGTFSIITAFMVLHHVENLDFSLKEINRVCKKNGYFVIREHDVFNYADWMLADIEHNMWTEVWGKKTDRSLRKYNKAYYKNWLEWDVIMNRFGFELVKGGFVSFSINWNLSPTRSFYGIYQKIKDVK